MANRFAKRAPRTTSNRRLELDKAGTSLNLAAREILAGPRPLVAPHHQVPFIEKDDVRMVGKNTSKLSPERGWVTHHRDRNTGTRFMRYDAV